MIRQIIAGPETQGQKLTGNEEEGGRGVMWYNWPHNDTGDEDDGGKSATRRRKWRGNVPFVAFYLTFCSDEQPSCSHYCSRVVALPCRTSYNNGELVRDWNSRRG